MCWLTAVSSELWLGLWQLGLLLLWTTTCSDTAKINHSGRCVQFSPSAESGAPQMPYGAYEELTDDLMHRACPGSVTTQRMAPLSVVL